MDIIKKIKEKIEEYSPQKYSFVLAFPIILLIVGFFIWNVYLYNFGFTEDEILKAKFILSGAIFLGITYLFFYILRFIGKLFSKIPLIKSFSEKDFYRTLKIFLNIIIFLLWFFTYVFLLFPSIPLTIGGGQPQGISIVGDLENEPILDSLGIKKAETAKYQTENLCLIHENSRGIYILRPERVLFLDRSLFQGVSTLPDLKSDIEKGCSFLARTWSIQSFIYFIKTRMF